MGGKPSSEAKTSLTKMVKRMITPWSSEEVGRGKGHREGKFSEVSAILCFVI
jgi:hypothetical protein